MPCRRVPTINDLRVKLCYICREEEKFDNPEEPPRAWTHPCKCTLVAHESCLLQWIQTSEANPSRADNALKCPQCGSIYELESDNPLVLRVLDTANKALSIMGRVVTITSISAVVATFGTGIYIISTAYGAYALQQFLGKEMYDLLLTDDPSNWPWHAFLNLPLIPLSLILSRTPLASNLLPIVPILLAWPTSSPVASRDRLAIEQWSRTQVATEIRAPSLSAWPPAPALFGFFVLPVTRMLYRRLFTKLSHWVLNTKPSPRASVRRFVWAMNDAGGFRIRIGANVEADEAEPAENVPQPAQQQQEGGADQVPAPAGDAAAAAAAERTISVTGASLGRLIGGSLIIPEIANVMGSLLYRLSKRSRILMKILAVKPPLQGLPPPPLGAYSLDDSWKGMSAVRKVTLMCRLMLGAMWGGTRTWAECDPVWWRNSIGLGLFVVAKDCVQLLHLWLAKHELETRRVKNRSFEGVDPRELDLIPTISLLD